MQPHCVGSLRKFARRMVPVAALFALAGVAYADQDVQSSDGQWKVHAKISDSLGVKKSSEAMVDISAAGMAKGCPKVASVAFEMPSHGHGGDVLTAVHGGNYIPGRGAMSSICPETQVTFSTYSTVQAGVS